MELPQPSSQMDESDESDLSESYLIQFTENLDNRKHDQSFVTPPSTGPSSRRTSFENNSSSSNPVPRLGGPLFHSPNHALSRPTSAKSLRKPTRSNDTYSLSKMFDSSSSDISDSENETNFSTSPRPIRKRRSMRALRRRNSLRDVSPVGRRFSLTSSKPSAPKPILSPRGSPRNIDSQISPRIRAPHPCHHFSPEFAFITPSQPNHKSTIDSQCYHAFLMSAAADAIGFHNEQWHEQVNPKKIISALKSTYGSFDNMQLSSLRVSDDTIVSLTTAETLIQTTFYSTFGFVNMLQTRLSNSLKSMSGRIPETQLCSALEYLDSSSKPGLGVPPIPDCHGSTPASRCLSIGLYFPNPSLVSSLVQYSISAVQLTHNNPFSFLSGLTAAAFSSFALNKVNICEWGSLLYHKILPMAALYLKDDTSLSQGSFSQHTTFQDYKLFWREYLVLRNLFVPNPEKYDLPNKVSFPKKYKISSREDFYQSLCFIKGHGVGCPAESSHSAVLIAYDSLLFSHGDWGTFCHLSCFHSGEGEASGCIGGFWFGLYYGLPDKYAQQCKSVEFESRIRNISSGFSQHIKLVDHSIKLSSKDSQSC